MGSAGSVQAPEANNALKEQLRALARVVQPLDEDAAKSLNALSQSPDLSDVLSNFRKYLVTPAPSSRKRTLPIDDISNAQKRLTTEAGLRAPVRNARGRNASRSIRPLRLLRPLKPLEVRLQPGAPSPSKLLHQKASGPPKPPKQQAPTTRRPGAAKVDVPILQTNREEFLYGYFSRETFKLSTDQIRRLVLLAKKWESQLDRASQIVTEKAPLWEKDHNLFWEKFPHPTSATKIGRLFHEIEEFELTPVRRKLSLVVINEIVEQEIQVVSELRARKNTIERELFKLEVDNHHRTELDEEWGKLLKRLEPYEGRCLRSRVVCQLGKEIYTNGAPALEREKERKFADLARWGLKYSKLCKFCPSGVILFLLSSNVGQVILACLTGYLLTGCRFEREEWTDHEYQIISWYWRDCTKVFQRCVLYSPLVDALKRGYWDSTKESAALGYNDARSTPIQAANSSPCYADTRARQENDNLGEAFVGGSPSDDQTATARDLNRPQLTSGEGDSQVLGELDITFPPENQGGATSIPEHVFPEEQGAARTNDTEHISSEVRGEVQTSDLAVYDVFEDYLRGMLSLGIQGAVQANDTEHITPEDGGETQTGSLVDVSPGIQGAAQANDTEHIPSDDRGGVQTSGLAVYNVFEDYEDCLRGILSPGIQGAAQANDTEHITPEDGGETQTSGLVDVSPGIQGAAQANDTEHIPSEDRGEVQTSGLAVYDIFKDYEDCLRGILSPGIQGAAQANDTENVTPEDRGAQTSDSESTLLQDFDLTFP
ncbi:MAG: hypothetical protein M1840_006323 [Geoglossum simile]|nr:MAG: hypothetical protein M1840_006323 [Geoglossum simile]